MTALAIARRVTTAIAVITNLVLTACGGSDGGPVSPVVVTPPTPVFVSLLFDCGADTTMTPGAYRLCTAEELWSDGHKVVVTGTANWSATGPVTVVPGKVTAMGPGEATVTVTHAGKTATVKLVVKPDGTPWSELPPISAEAKALVKENLISGRLVRWSDKDYINRGVWLDPEMKRRGMADVLGFWGLTEEPDSAKALRLAVFDSSITNSSVCGGADFFISTNTIIRVVLRVATRAECSGGDDKGRNTLIHELGHSEGLFSHTPGCDDIMGSPCYKMEKSPLLLEYLDFIRKVAPGKKPID